MNEVRVRRTQHGPFERIVLTTQGKAPEQGFPQIAELSVYRVGDLLIDTGSTRVADTLVEILASAPPKQIVLTHQHEDHAGGLTALEAAFGAVPVHAPQDHVELIHSGVSVPAHRRFFWGEQPPFKNVIPYEEGAEFHGGTISLRALETPGHTPGHMSLVSAVEGTTYALTGDLYFGSRLRPAWYESAADRLVTSQLRIAELADRVVMLPTHGKVREDGREVLLRNVEELRKQMAVVEDTAKTEGTNEPHALAAKLYGPDPLGAATGYEISNAAFIRSVLNPVHSLPAAPIEAPPDGNNRP